MEKNSNISSEKINLSNIYTEKELDSLKKIFPNLSSLITAYPVKTSNSSNPIESNKVSQFIDKDKFVKLITEKMLNSLKGENSEIIAKSFGIILNDNKDTKKEEKEKSKKQRKTVKITKNRIFVDFTEKQKTNGDLIFFPTKLPKKNIILDKYINSTKNKNNVNVNFNLKNINNKSKKKYLNNKNENNISDYNVKNNKSNSIINNFITFSNISKNQISNYSNIYNNDTITNNSTTSRRSVPLSITKNSKESNINSAKRQISPFKLFANYLTIEKHKSPIKKPEFRKINTSKQRKTDAYSINFIKKIEKIKTEINIEKKNIKKKNKRLTIAYNNNKPAKAKLNLNLTNAIISNRNAHKNTVYKKMTIQPKIKLNKTEIATTPIILNTPSLTPKSEELIDSKDFNIFNFESSVGQENTLYLIGLFIFKKYEFSKIIKENNFINWSKKIAAGYSRKNPYHTDLHGADVTQTCFISLLQENVVKISKIDNNDICALITSCMCHDFKHGGLNNNFLRLTKDKLAIRYNDISILENMHISEAFKLMNTNPECDLFSGVDKKLYEKMRKQMISCVLSTDMANHKGHINFMKTVISQKNDKNEDSQEYMNLLIHAADVSNPTKPFNIYFKWAKLVVEEFCQQGDKEKALGLECTCDRKTVNLSKNQIGFIDYVVEEFVSNYIKVFPSLKFLHDNLVQNRELFVNYKEESDNSESNQDLIKK
jgi:hypothetical protein